MKSCRMARKCIIQGCSGQLVEVFYADAEYIAILSADNFPMTDGREVVLSTAQYPSFSVYENMRDTVTGIEESALSKCILQRIMVADNDKYFVRKDGKVIKIERESRYSLIVKQFAPKEFAEIVKEAAFKMCKA